MDWGDGQYELMARTLSPAAARVVDAASIAVGTRVLDVGCGTGNAALIAARRGADVLAIDPSPRLLSVADRRAREEGLTLKTAVAEAARLPVDDASFDVVLSVFAVIFAPDAEAAAAEMMRVVRPTGRIVLSTWLATGAIAEAGAILRRAASTLAPAGPSGKPAAWGDPSFVRELFAGSGGRVELEEATLTFEAASPEAWFEEQEQHHPMWRGIKGLLGEEAWADVRRPSVEALRAGNEARDGFRVTSRYLVVIVTRA